MTKLIPAIAAALIAASIPAAVARDITTLDGKVYKDVTITSVTPAGFDICYTPQGGGLAIKELFFRDLPEDIRKEFHYNVDKAKAFDDKVYKARKNELTLEIKEEKDAAAAAARKQQIEDHYTAVAAAGKKYVNLKSIRSSGGGMIAYMSSINATVTTGLKGKVFVSDLDLPQENEWEGYVYPIGKVKKDGQDMEAYVTSLETAVYIMSKGQFD